MTPVKDYDCYWSPICSAPLTCKDCDARRAREARKAAEKAATEIHVPDRSEKFCWDFSKDVVFDPPERKK